MWIELLIASTVVIGSTVLYITKRNHKRLQTEPEIVDNPHISEFLSIYPNLLIW
ncbi:MAG: hypothetical protein K0R05_975 [Anaerocolumna sp.]|jgi:hypothetical protein|nr:hypothetical protein [Anaerocolumna sp.]